jgi:hypothetical protein
MIRMGVGDEDEVDFFWREPILLHLVEDLLKMAGMARIDEEGHLPIDHISVTIVLIGILPQVGIEALSQFHRLPVNVS